MHISFMSSTDELQLQVELSHRCRDGFRRHPLRRPDQTPMKKAQGPRRLQDGARGGETLGQDIHIVPVAEGRRSAPGPQR